MKHDRRTREQRKADASAMAAIICFALVALLIAITLSTDAGGAEQDATAPVAEVEAEAETEGNAPDPAWDTPATESSCIDLGEPMGKFTLTAYCACAKCCGKWANGITATGTTATEGRTIAVDPDTIPYGSTVTIHFADGSSHSYVAEDCGGAIKGNRIDVFFASHEDALWFGVQDAYVYVGGAA